jgi:hypothetical protein
MNKTLDLNTMKYVTKTDLMETASPRGDQNLKMEALSFTADEKNSLLDGAAATIQSKKEYTTFDAGVQTEEFTWLQVSPFEMRLSEIFLWKIQ